ncbi:unnamed protein product [Gongylonema pulchrum]|uniref:Protein kinase domain-containing protein n=1 Tax=Gongylonema pulchrum TaxID=637853 RepID=A0A183CVI8_9BILA|nr:unnamed protein product [Gongylonema pulchrum]
MFRAFYINRIFTNLSEFYVLWASHCSGKHSRVRAILIKAQRLDPKPRRTITMRKRQFAIEEEKLILKESDADSSNEVAKKAASDPWDEHWQAKLMLDMEAPQFVKNYDRASNHVIRWEAYVYNYVKEKLDRISGTAQIYSCLTFVDRGLIVREKAFGTLREICNAKVPEIVVAVIALDLMKILRCIHGMNVIHACFSTDHILIASK